MDLSNLIESLSITVISEALQTSVLVLGQLLQQIALDVSAQSFRRASGHPAPRLLEVLASARHLVQIDRWPRSGAAGVNLLRGAFRKHEVKYCGAGRDLQLGQLRGAYRHPPPPTLRFSLGLNFRGRSSGLAEVIHRHPLAPSSGSFKRIELALIGFA